MASEGDVSPAIQEDGFWRNCFDSLTHALDHFSSINYSDDRFHNRKWAILSVTHAAAVFCNFLLSTLDPRHPCGGRYPALSAIEQLQKHTEAHRLSATERHVIRDIFSVLPRMRNTLMHRAAPPVLDVSDAAVALLALLYLVRRRTGIAASQLIGQDPAIEIDVLDELRVREQNAGATNLYCAINATYNR
jgi:hypothetical protein